MPDRLTPAEAAAIAAYTRPPTICPPQTFTPGLEFQPWNHRPVKPSSGSFEARRERQLRREEME